MTCEHKHKIPPITNDRIVALAQKAENVYLITGLKPFQSPVKASEVRPSVYFVFQVLHPGQSRQVQLHVDDQQLQLLPRRDGRGLEVVDFLRRPERQAEVVPQGQPQRTRRREQRLFVALPSVGELSFGFFMT